MGMIENEYGTFRCSQIIASRMYGKWVELWLDDGDRDPSKYDVSSKPYKIHELTDSNNVNDWQLDFVGLWVMFKKIGPNMEPVSVGKSLIDLDGDIIHGAKTMYDTDE